MAGVGAIVALRLSDFMQNPLSARIRADTMEQAAESRCYPVASATERLLAGYAIAGHGARSLRLPARLPLCKQELVWLNEGKKRKH